MPACWPSRFQRPRDLTEQKTTLPCPFSFAVRLASVQVRLALLVPEAACSCSFTRATSSTAVAASVELFAIATGELEVAHASLANGVLEIVPLSGAVSGIVAGAAVSVTRVLAAGAVSTASGFSSTGSQDSTGIFLA